MLYLGIERSGILSAAVCCLVFFVGCGPRLPATAPVHGKITLGGKAMDAGRIAFHPAAGRTALGTIAADGTYTLTTFRPGDGALLGKHRVTIEATKIVAPAAPRSLEEELRGGAISPGVPRVQWLVPEVYSRPETTPLKADVEPGTNTINFDLPRT
jgi:hypothetical protein